MSGPTLYDTASPLVLVDHEAHNSILLLTILLTSAFLLRSCVAAADANRLYSRWRAQNVSWT